MTYSNGTVIQGATVTIVNEQDNVNHRSMRYSDGRRWTNWWTVMEPRATKHNALASIATEPEINFTVVTTGSNGHTPLPSQNASLIISDNVRSNNYGGVTENTNFTYNITATIGTLSATISGLDTNSSWLRTNIDIPTYTVTCTIDVGTCSLSGISQSEAPLPSSPSNQTDIQRYVESTCGSTLQWGIVGSALIIILIIISAGGIALGYLTKTSVMDLVLTQEFVMGLIMVVVIGSIGVAIISPIITVIACP